MSVAAGDMWEIKLLIDAWEQNMDRWANNGSGQLLWAEGVQCSVGARDAMNDRSVGQFVIMDRDILLSNRCHDVWLCERETEHLEGKLVFDCSSFILCVRIGWLTGRPSNRKG